MNTKTSYTFVLSWSLNIHVKLVSTLINSRYITQRKPFYCPFLRRIFSLCSYCMLGKYFSPFYFCVFCPCCQRANLRFLKLSLFKQYFVRVNLRCNENVCKWRRANIMWGKNNPVYSMGSMKKFNSLSVDNSGDVTCRSLLVQPYPTIQDW